jgi:predicted O-linked N-acetylglucosamine transferase (SPINDLY family)
MSKDNSQGSMAQAVALHQAGQLDAAAGIYREILARSPRDFDANHLLGVVALQQRRFESAQSSINLALTIRPGDAPAMGNLGVSYLQDGKPDEARHWFEKALEITPNSPPALANLASVLHDLGQYREAIPLARKARKLDPGSYDASNVLGACLFKTGTDREAVEVLQAATRLQPDRTEAWANLSTVLRSLGQEDLANEYAAKAGALSPDSAVAMGALAAAEYGQGNIAGAIEKYGKLVLLSPHSADIRIAYAHALLDDDQNVAALEQLQKAQALRDKDLTIRWASVTAQLKAVYMSEVERVASREAFDKRMDSVRQWYESTPAIEAPFKAVGVNQPFLLAFHPENNRELLSRYGELCSTFMATYPLPAGVPGKVAKPASVTAGARKLRLGVVSAQVRNHSVWNAITKGWLQNLDPSRFEVHLFQVDVAADEETAAAKALVAHLEDRPRDLSGWIQTIKGADLDVILYPEIGMHALTLKLACLRLAPIQAATWGHPETTGLPTMDLYISAAAIEPPAADGNYTERLVTLPNLGVYVEPLAPQAREINLRTLKLPRDEPLLLCPGSPFKYGPRYDSVWVQIAQRLGRKTLFRRSGGGRLVFFKFQGDERNRRLETRLRAAFDAAGVDFDSHVSFLQPLKRPDFFALMRRSALMLDTLSFSGFNTAIQAIECGLPMLAFEGEFMRGRLASGILRQLDLPQLVATTTDEFVQRAVELAHDPAGRKELQARILAGHDRVFRDLAPVRALEDCLLEAGASTGRVTSPRGAPTGSGSAR